MLLQLWWEGRDEHYLCFWQSALVSSLSIAGTGERIASETPSLSSSEILSSEASELESLDLPEASAKGDRPRLVPPWTWKAGFRDELKPCYPQNPQRRLGQKWTATKRWQDVPSFIIRLRRTWRPSGDEDLAASAVADSKLPALFCFLFKYVKFGIVE